jgi:hypothetical protein
MNILFLIGFATGGLLWLLVGGVTLIWVHNKICKETRK